MAKDYRAIAEIDGAEIDVRFVSQTRRDAITEKYTRRIGGAAIGRTDWDRVNEELADEMIVGWRNLKLATVMRFGFEDFDTLTPDAEGNVPYSQLTARLLISKSLRVLRSGEPGFAQIIDDVSRGILEAQARKNAPASPSSESSPVSTG